MLTNQAYHDRIADRLVDEDISGADRFVDAGVTLHVVTADPKGQELIPGCPPMRIVSTSRHGGIIDTKTVPATIGPGSKYERVWYCSQDQHAILFSKDSKRPGQIVKGSEGAGKTTLLAQWHYFCWLHFLGEGREGGQTGPTNERLGAVKTEMQKLYAPNWCRWVERTDFTGFEFCDRTKIRFRYTHQQSAAKGPPVQSYNWSWCGRDEMQDQVEAHGDIQARGRSAPNGYYRQLGTATSKDSPAWRTLRDRLEASGLWNLRTLLGLRSPFIWSAHWEAMRATMPLREYKRRVEALDLPPETAVYPEWSRDTNMIVVPELGWTDVTAMELRASGPSFEMLVGHDPGRSIDVSLLAKAYVRNQDLTAYQRGTVKPFWVVRGEVNTEQSTTERHIVELLKVVRDHWRLNLVDRQGRTSGAQILVRADPAGNSDNRTDKTVYTQFANAGIRIRPGAYNAEGDGHGRVPREEGVELVNTLICNAAGQRRLFVEKLPDGRPAAPKLVAALESSERDDSGRAEIARVKGGATDQTHWPAALRYMLWAIERPRLQLLPREVT